MPAKLSKELTVALEASQRAAEVVMRYYARDVRVEQKADASPVTIADREAELIIRKILQKDFPVYGLSGEEFGTTPEVTPAQWIIDPIDGTKNFIKGIPLFGILIALLHGGKLELGVSNVPGMKEIMYGQRGLGAFLNDTPVHVSAVAQLSDSMVSIGGLNHFAKIGKAESLLKVMAAPARVRSFGDAYAYHLVASGKFEAVVEAKVDFWDVAAPAAILEAAGGMCTDIDGHPLTESSHTIIASNGKVHEEIVKLFRS